MRKAKGRLALWIMTSALTLGMSWGAFSVNTYADDEPSAQSEVEIDDGNVPGASLPGEGGDPTPEPTPEPTEAPTPEPTEEPEETPTTDPTEVSTPTPEPTPTPTPEPTPTPAPTPTPTPKPTATPTPAPTATPTPKPTATPTPKPTATPTPKPTATPTPKPTATPTPKPTATPTPKPTATPTPKPTQAPTAAPTKAPESNNNNDNNNNNNNNSNNNNNGGNSEPAVTPTPVPTEVPTEEPTATEKPSKKEKDDNKEKEVTVSETQVDTAAGVNSIVMNNDKKDFINASGFFTEKELRKIENGSSVKVWLDVKGTDINEISGQDRAELTVAIKKARPMNAVQGPVEGVCMDITLYKQVGSKSDKAAVANPGINVSITVGVPEELLNTDDNIIRTYQMAILHEGVARVVPGEYNAETQEFTFESDGFSIYMLTYNDVRINTAPQQTEQTNSNVMPKSVSIQPKKELDHIEIGDTIIFQIVAEPKNANVDNTVWSSDNEEVVYVDNSGMATVKGNGRAVIAIVTENGKAATYVVDTSQGVKTIAPAEETHKKRNVGLIVAIILVVAAGYAVVYGYLKKKGII